MNPHAIFEMALGLEGTPWKISSVEFDRGEQQLNIHLSYPAGSKFPHPATQRPCPVYDSNPRKWRHLNFFQFKCYLHAPLPRVDGGSDGGVNTVLVPWARPQSGFTLMMESLMVILAQTGMTTQEVSEVIGEYAQRVWMILFHHVEKAHKELQLGDVRTLSIDEVSRRKGHDYITVVSEPGDREAGTPSRVLAVVPGKSAESVSLAASELAQRGLAADMIENVCIDMSAAFAAGVGTAFPKAKITFDHFHIIQLINTAMDQVRRRERTAFPEELKHSRWLLVRPGESLSEEQKSKVSLIRRSHCQTGKAYNMLDSLRSILRNPDRPEAEAALWRWTSWPIRSRIPEMKRAALTIREHFEGIVQFIRTRITNAAAEALNGIIQCVKRKSRGFRSFHYFQTMIYLVASRLSFDLPNPIPATHTKS